MSDLFELKSIAPMLLKESKPFDSAEYIYELKMDGIRALAYLDANGTELRNKRNNPLNEMYPELSELHRLSKNRCILDGEIITMRGGKPDFFSVQHRCLMRNRMKISHAAKELPAMFVAFDIIFETDHALFEQPLMDRKARLQTVMTENESLTISRYIVEHGVIYFNLAAEQQLEGVVAKRMTSFYRPGKRTSDWIKFKAYQEEELYICGLTPGDHDNIKTLQICSKQGDLFIHQGSVNFYLSGEIQRHILEVCHKNFAACPLSPPIKIPQVIWMQPRLQCKVQFMERTSSGLLRQAVFRGLVE